MAYTAAHPDAPLRIQWDVQPLSGFESRSLAEVVDDYDLIIVDHPHMADAARRGFLLPVGTLDDQFVGLARDSYEFDSQYWAVPIDIACHVAAYHRDHLDKPPCTWSEVETFAASGMRIGIALAGVHSLLAFYTLIES
ncbi:MAG: hypothetical protein ACR2NU_05350, partial [Aeoliella sp.]